MGPCRWAPGTRSPGSVFGTLVPPTAAGATFRNRNGRVVRGTILRAEAHAMPAHNVVAPSTATVPSPGDDRYRGLGDAPASAWRVASHKVRL